MSKHSKTLEKLCRIPTPGDIKWDDLQALLKHLGYKVLNGRGSRRKFYNQTIDDLIICHEPHPSPEVDKACVDDVVEHLRSHKLIASK